MKKLSYKTIISLPVSIVLSVSMIPPFEAYGQDIANDVYVYQFLTDDLGLNHASASGLMANIYKESSFIPTASCVDTNGKISYGLMQWNGSRFEDLKSFCQSNGYGYDTLEGQLAYIENDLTGAYSGYYDYLLTCIPDTAEGAYDAAYFWATEYEVCSRKYVVPRAELARDFYYPEFMGYAPVTAEMMGEELYISLTNAETGNYLAQGERGATVYRSGEQAEVWKFTRTGTCTYEAENAVTGQPLSIDGNKYKWHFVKNDNGYILEEENSGQVLGVSQAGDLQLQDGTNASSQCFNIEEFTPAKASEELWAYYDAAPSVTDFSWEPAEGADSYRLKIYRGSSVDGTPVRVVGNITETQCSVSLKSGEYAAVVESVNECGYTESDPVKFTIEQQETADLGDEFTAKISWNNEKQYLTVTDDLEVKSGAADYETNQLWKFVRCDDGSYKISAYDSGKTLTSDDENIASLQNEEETWVIYGSQEQGYILESSEKELVLSAAEQAAYKVSEYGALSGQKFEIKDYVLQKPVLGADASGGISEPVIFAWTKADSVDGYTLKVMDESGDVTATLNIRDNDNEADILLPEGKYSAVIAAKSKVTGEWTESDETEFEVKALPERPYVELEISSNPMELSFKWEKSNTADRYSYVIKDAETGETIKQKRSVKGCSDKLILKAGEYVLTVTAHNEEGSIRSEGTEITIKENEDGAGVVSMKSVLAAKKQSVSQEN